MTTKEIKKWWEEVSKGYQKSAKIPTSSAHYGPFAPDENELKLLGDVKGKKILEIGCGGGQCSIAFAKQGAKATGIDISIEQLKYAKALAKKNKVNVNFIRGDIQKLTGIKSNTYDIVFSAFALQYIPDLTKGFKEVYRALKKNGLFVFSFGHPFNTSLSPKTLKIEQNYNKSGKLVEIEIWPDRTKHKFIAYRRKISEIHDSILKSGLFLERIIEPLKLKQKAWKGGSWKENYPLKLIKMIGPTIIFKCRKK